MKRLIIIILGLMLTYPSLVLADKVKLPDKKAQGAFTQEYLDAKAAGGKEWYDYRSKMTQNADEAEYQMYKNLEEGKTAGGGKKSKKQKAKEQQYMEEQSKKPKGFMGDPNDPGPQDWSDWNIKTDGKGNVIGFEEKDFDQKDKNGDGKIDDKERKDWNEKKKKENEENGGAPGAVPPIADWDKDGNGVPDNGWTRWCWQCCKGQEQKKHECDRGFKGQCNPDPCKEEEKCYDHEEKMPDGTKFMCYECEPNEEPIPWCEDKGYSSDPRCNGQCPPIACVPIDVDIRGGSIVPTSKTRERGSTKQCYTCMKVEEVVIEYYVIIIEGPGVRYVLGRNTDIQFDPKALSGFSPASIMALAQVDQTQLAEFQKLASLMQGKITIGKIADIGKMLGDKFGNKKTRYNDSCFDDFNAKEPEQTPPKGSDEPKEKKKRSKNTPPPEAQSAESYGSDDARDVKVDGPVIACGKTGNEETLAVFGANGALIENIPKKELIKNPGKILDVLMKAEETYQKVMSLKNMTPQGLLNQITSTLSQKIFKPRTSEQEWKKTIKEKKRAEKIRKKKRLPEIIVDPNDPLYFYIDPKQLGKKKKKSGGLLGGLARVGLSVVGGVTGSGDGIVGGEVGINLGSRDKNDLKDQWGIQTIGYLPKSDPNSAWNIIDGRKKNVIVAVIDSGLDMSHPDGPQYIWTNEKEIPNNGIDDDGNGYIDDIYGWNFIDNNNDLRDFKGHGTSVAGIIAAKTNNGMGIAGINPGAVIMPLKVANEEGMASNLNIYRALHYAVDNGAKIINMSLGGRSVSRLEQAAINYAYDQGVFVAIASGNNGLYLGDLGPASAFRAFTVGASDLKSRRSTISSYGPNNAIMAPGENIYSIRSIDSFSKRAYGKDSLKRLYFRQSGTSFSAPMVAATASLLLAKDPTLTNVEIADILMGTATDMDEEGWDGVTGAGLLNAAEALRTTKRNFQIIDINHVKFNKDKRGKFESLDVYGTVKGDFDDFVVEIGKGKHANKFKTVAGPFKDAADYDWICRIDKDKIRGSKDWILRIKAIDKEGKERIARVAVDLNRK